MKKNLVKVFMGFCMVCFSLASCTSTNVNNEEDEVIVVDEDVTPNTDEDEVIFLEDNTEDNELIETEKVDAEEVREEETNKEVQIIEDVKKIEEKEVSKETTEEVKKERPVIIGMPNPFYTFDNLEEAAEVAGFSIELPPKNKLPSWVNLTVYRPTKTKLLEVIYSEDDSYKREIRIRKALTNKKDISGNYNSYDTETVLYINGILCNVRTNDDIIYEAYWHNEDYSYSIHISDGLAEEHLIEMVKIIK